MLPFDEAAARRYGSLRAALEVAGTPVGDADMRIASITLAHGLTVVTANVRHFQRVSDLTVEDWLARSLARATIESQGGRLARGSCRRSAG